MTIIANQLPAFDTFNPQHNIALLESSIAQAKCHIDKLVNQSTFTWSNLMLPMAGVDEQLSRLWGPVSHLHSVCNTDDIRPVYEQGVQIMTQWGTWLAQHQGLYQAIQQLANSDAFAQLPSDQQTAIQHTLRDFRLSGSELEGEAKHRYADIKMRLAELSTIFSQHVLDATQAFELLIDDKKKLAGLPDSVLEAAAQRASESEQKGWLFTLDIPSYLPLMQYADASELRQTMYEQYVSRASHGELDNTAVIDEILALRQESAQLLGFDCYATYSLADKMAKDVG
ncbi:MAG: M3 family metallopeptidase, partial [Ghiorsea sp.]